jgi:Xaa-Pro aminopeptidase
MREKELDGFFTSSVANITYLTGFTGDSSRLLVSKKKTILITDGRYTEQARSECPESIEVVKWIDNKRYARDTYKPLIEKCNIRNLALESKVLTYSEYETLRQSLGNTILWPMDGLIEKLRTLKDAQEIEYLRTACEISDRALELTLPYIKQGITELELTAQLEYQLKMNGAENLSFDSLILSGARTSLLHGKPSSKRLESGDLVLFDFGALYKGYHADISRTFVLGKASEKQKEVYSIIQQAQRKAVESLRAGVTAKTPDAVVRSVIPEHYLEYYYPGLGHGVGLEIHETPFLGKDTPGELDMNTAITIEPGIYIPSWGGIRIEDTVVVRQDNADSLSKFPRELMEM